MSKNSTYKYTAPIPIFRLFLIVACLALSNAKAQTNPVYHVDTTGDGHDNDLTDGECATSTGDCTLRAALEQNNATPGAAGYQGLIHLPAGDYLLTEGGLNITTGVSVIGDGPLTTRIDANQDRGFYIKGDDSFIAHLSGFTLRNAFLGAANSDFAAGAGGGMYIGPEATVNLGRVHVVQCSTDWQGGGIYNLGTLQISGGRISENTVPMHDGSGVEGRGGGIWSSGVLRIFRTLLSDNKGTWGGAVYNIGSALMSHSTMTGNQVTFKGGGIYNAGSDFGDHFWIDYSTITRNETWVKGYGSRPSDPNPGGGGIYNAELLAIANSIVAENVDSQSVTSPDYSPDCWSAEHEGSVYNEETEEYETVTKVPTFTSERNNIVGELNPENCNMKDAFWDGLPFDMVGSMGLPINPLLDDLRLNGADVQSHALLPGSPAIDEAGTPKFPSFILNERDQRGILRPIDFVEPWDIGAFEVTPQTTSMEAEDGRIMGAYLHIGTDVAASGGEYVYVPSHLPNATEEPDEQQRLELEIYIENAGNYNIVGWAQGDGQDHNSFWVRVDDMPTEAYLWDIQNNNSTYVADPVSHRGNGNEGAPEVDPISVYFSRGAHIIKIYLRENVTRLDRIEIVPVTVETQMLEVESSSYLTGAFIVANDPAASNSQYVIHPASQPDFANGPDDAHKIVQNITVDEAGTYLIRSHVWAEFDSKNSFYVKVDGLPEVGYLWDMTENNFSFGLDYVSDRGNGSTGNPEQDPVEIYLSEGEHIIEVFAREAGTGIDNIGLELKSNADAKIISRNKPAYSSSNENGSLTPDKAVDGDPNTRWSSQFSEPQWIKIDLQGTYDVHRVVLDWQNSHGVEYKIQISDDAWNWTTLYHKTGGDGGTDNLIVNGKGRYIRMKGIDRSTQYGFSLWEFDVYGTSADSGGGTSFVCEGDCLNAEPIVKDEIKVLNTTGDRWYVVNDNVNGWQASEMAGRSIFVNGVQVQPGEVPLPAKVNGKYYFHFTAGEHPWASWSFWNW